MWYYSDRAQQKGPVPFDELRERAQAGYLRPSDMVWQEGTPDWVRASMVDGLFDVAAEPPPVRDWDEPRRPPREGNYRDRDYPDRDYRGGDYHDRPLRRALPPRQEGMSSGLKVGLIIGGVVLGLLIVGIILIFVVASGPSQTYNITLGPGGVHSRTFHFNA
jgi:hypothetical protein